PKPWTAAMRSAGLIVTRAYYNRHMPESPLNQIAANLRALRERAGLSVVTLAARSGVARATLTKLGAGQGNPAGDPPYALADALGAPLSDVIGLAAAAPVEVIRAGGGTHVSGTVSARLLDRIHGHRLAELYDISFASRARRAGPHPRGVVESLLLTSG